MVTRHVQFIVSKMLLHIEFPGRHFILPLVAVFGFKKHLLYGSVSGLHGSKGFFVLKQVLVKRSYPNYPSLNDRQKSF